MIRCRWSVNVSRLRSPTSSQNVLGSGSVASISEKTGAIARR
jgi:hypothetical protein